MRDRHALSAGSPMKCSAEYGPWNPGIESELPLAFLPLATVFHTANVFDSIAQLEELHDFCGLPLEALSMFKPERLALHEVLIRVMADLSVPDGEKYEDLGVNFRHMTARIMEDHVAPRLPAIDLAFCAFREAACRFLKEALEPRLVPRTPAVTGSGRWSFSRLLGSRRSLRSQPRASVPTAAEEDAARIAAMRLRSQSVSDPFEAACYRALVAAMDAIFATQGRLISGSDLIVAVALRLVCNDHGSSVVGTVIDEVLPAAVECGNYRWLPPQTHPLVMNVKGASASGKSTMRPLEKQLARKLGVNWEDFALISPDIWRKYLLDYDSLGPAHRYAGTLTGMELAIIDRKLDRYMAHKAKVGNLTHLLIDRFRFDSFSNEPDEEDGSRLLTRFGTDVYMFFMITPPEETIERAWTRGLQVGRYKAVDDLLAHNVEAYSGIPGLFFTWALRDDKRVHFEFLDNSVPEGHRPRTVAFGANGVMNILDLSCLLDVDRYQKINVNAKRPSEIYAQLPSKDEDFQASFVKECVRRIPCVNFANQDTGDIYARTVSGDLVYWDARRFDQALSDRRSRAAIATVLQARKELVGESGALSDLDPRDNVTLGEWGKRRTA
ncbi:MAG: hypothetical protein U1E60_16140 [Reyranellaceae bacterium]